MYWEHRVKFAIRLGRAADAEALSELSFRSKRSNGYDEEFMVACREELAVASACIERGVYLVAVSEIRICGFVSLVVDPGPVETPAGEITAFFVEPDFKRCGIGRDLCRVVMERAVHMGLSRIYLDADPHAVDFYTAMGFTVVGASKSGSIPGRTLPRMETWLSGFRPTLG